MARGAMAEIIALVAKGRASFYEGRTSDATYWATLGTMCEGMSFPPFAAHSLGSLALIEAHDGNLTRAHDLATRALSVAREVGFVGHIATGDALLALGVIFRERGDFEKATVLLQEAATIASQSRSGGTSAASGVGWSRS